MKIRVFAHAAALALAVFLASGGPAHALDINSKDIILKSDYELGVLAGYGWCMDNHLVAPDIEHAVVMPSFSIPLIKREIGSSFYRGVIQYQFEPVIGYIVEPNHRMEFGASLIGFKYNFTGLQSRVSPYSTFGFGVIDEPIGHHVQGSDFNFMLQTGVGVQYFIDDKRAVNLQYRYRHISNAGIKQPNWGINSSFLLVGMSFF